MFRHIFSNACLSVMPLLPPHLQQALAHRVPHAGHPLHRAGLPCHLELSLSEIRQVRQSCPPPSLLQPPLLAWSDHHGAGPTTGQVSTCCLDCFQLTLHFSSCLESSASFSFSAASLPPGGGLPWSPSTPRWAQPPSYWPSPRL